MPALGALGIISALTWPAEAVTSVQGQGAGGAASPEKDFWDKLEASSGIVAGVLVAVIGALATYVYNRRQQQATAADNERQRAAEDARAERELAVLRVQTIQTFFPHLKSNDERDREAALLAIDALGDHELANQLAVSYGGKAAVGALSRIAASAPDETADRAAASLATVVDVLRGSVVTVGSAEGYGTGFIVRHDGVVATVNFVADMGDELRVRFATGDEHPASLLYRDPGEIGVGLLEIPGDRLPSLRLATEPPEIGEDVVTLSSPIVGGDPVSAGVITHLEFALGHLLEVHARIKTEPGFAGAPLVRASGDVVAVHVGARPNPDGTKTAYGIPAATFANALSSLD